MVPPLLLRLRHRPKTLGRKGSNLCPERVRRSCDIGSQFTSVRYGERIAELGAVPSIGSVGDSYDNVFAESVNALYKTELIYGPDQGPWRTIEDVELATLSWVHGTTPNDSTATSTTYHPPSSKPLTTLRPRPPARQPETKPTSLHQTQGDSDSSRS